jgi:tetratricopeptide (TPR) repeat protein
MDIATLQNLEASGAHAALEQMLARARAPQILQFAAAYYVRRGKPAKVLSYYAEYVQAAKPGQRDLGAVAMAIECARRLGRHDLVTGYFLSLSKDERESLKSEALISVAASFTALHQFAEAERIAEILRARSGLPQLPDFDCYVREKYGDSRAVRQFIESTPARFDRADISGSVQKALAIAIAHMAEGNYPTAVAVLEHCKAVVS